MTVVQRSPFAGMTEVGDLGRVANLTTTCSHGYVERMSVPDSEADSSPAIEVRGLRKSYGDVEAVRGIDLSVSRGEVFALLGPNGAGKTTTVEILEGHRARTAGDVSVLGHDPGQNERALKQRIGIVLQTTGVEPYLTVEETIDLFLRVLSSPAAARGDPGRDRAEGASPHSSAASVRGPAAAAGRGDRPRGRPGAALPGRADDGPGPRGAARSLGDGRQPPVSRQDGRAHDPLHGRGGAAGRPGGDHRAWGDRRRGHPGRSGA